MKVLKAYTTTKDGLRVDADPRKIISQRSPQSAGAPMYGDAKIERVVFPAVKVGSVLRLPMATIGHAHSQKLRSLGYGGNA